MKQHKSKWPGLHKAAALLLALVLVTGAGLMAGAATEEPTEEVLAAEANAEDSSGDLLPGEDNADMPQQAEEDEETEAGADDLEENETGEEEEELLFDYDPQPTSAEEVAALVADVPVGDAGAVLDFLMALPKWEFAIEESWLPAGWRQSAFTDEETGAVYWRLVMGVQATADKTVGSEEALRSAVLNCQRGDYIYLTNDITLTSPIPLDLPQQNAGSGSRSLSIIGNGHTLTASGDFFHFEHTNGAFILQDITLSGGRGMYSKWSGNVGGSKIDLYQVTFRGSAGVYLEGKRSAQDYVQMCNFYGDNTRAAIYMDNVGANSTIFNVLNISNYGTENSGAVYAANSDLELFATTIRDSGPTGLAGVGGAVHFTTNAGNTLAISLGTFTNNTAYRGGAIYMEGNGSLSMRLTQLHNNEAGAEGGAVYLESGSRLVGGTPPGNTATYLENWAGSHGGAIYAAAGSSIVLGSDQFSGNLSGTGGQGHGGAVYLDAGASLTMTGGSFSGNRSGVYASSGAGGAIYTLASDVTLSGVSFSGNQSPNDGGAILIDGSGAASITGGSFANSYADGYGGAIAVYSGVNNALKLTGTDFITNDAGWDGGAVAYLAGGSHTITGGEFNDNYAYLGGALYIGDGAVTIQDAEFIANIGTDGGAIYTYDELTVAGTLFEDNFAYSSGGAVFANGAPDVSFDDCEFTGNSADEWRGGALLVQDGPIEITNSLLEDNQSYRSGGAVYLENATATAANTGFVNNKTTATGQADGQASGGAVYAGANSAVTVKGNGKVQGNSTTQSGGGIYLEDGSTLALEGTVALTGNSAAADGGAVYVGWDYIANVTATAGVTFGGNTVPSPRDLADPAHRTIHDGLILGSAFTAPYDHAYNNADIAYTYGAPMPQQYTVTFDAGAGSYTGPGTVQVEAGQLVPQPAEPKLTGHDFIGWYDEDDGGKLWIFEDDAEKGLTGMVMPGRNVTLTARYGINKYSLTFDYGYGGLKDVSTLEYDQVYTLPAAPTRSGYTFTGWKDHHGHTPGSGTLRMPAGDLTYTAQWKANGGGSSSSAEPVPSSSDGGGGGTPEPGTSSSSSSTRVISSSSGSASSSSSSAGSGSASAGSSTDVAEPADTSASGETAVVNDMDDNGEDADESEGTATINLFGNQIPTGGLSSSDGWSILNLLLSLLTLISTVIMALRFAIRRKKSGGIQDDEFVRDAAGRKLTLWRILACVSGVLPLILLPILENFSKNAMLISRWTPLFLALLVLHAVLAVLSAVMKPSKQNI